MFKNKEMFNAINGDSIIEIKNIPDESIGLIVFSPPFPGMYAYTDSEADIGNCSSIDELLQHFGFMVGDLNRIAMPGRSCCIHLTQEPIFKWQEGYCGMRDFRGEVIRLMQRHDWIFASERMIDKDPILKGVRTRDAGLAMKTAATDSSKLTGVMTDYLLQFRKKGNNPIPIRALIDHPTHPEMRNTDGWITCHEWQWWASSVWWNSKRHTPDGGISESDVLSNYRDARDDKDEKHLCPLQLGVIDRCVKIWSAPNDIIFSPFMGIGSEGYQSILNGRRFIGIELKESYYNIARQNLEAARKIFMDKNMDLLDFIGCGNETEWA
jgi:hypothetical protein